MSLLQNAVTEPKPSSRAPRWLSETPIVIAGNHDSIPIFMRRRGGGMVGGEEEEFENTHGENFAAKLKRDGITLWMTYFYKGFGIEAEKEYMEITRNFVPLLRKYGVKVGAYIGSTIAYETFLLEKPEAEEWLVPDYLGKPVTYGVQVFRKRVYFMHPGYVDYMKRVVTMAVRDAKVDLIHFDNPSMQAVPEIFEHPLAIEDFRQFLKDNYSPQELKKRLGFGDVRYVMPPKVDFPLTTIDDPLFQMWAKFRWRQLVRYYTIMADLIRSLNPQAAVETNPHAEIAGTNYIWGRGIYYPPLLDKMDAVWTEEGNPAGVTPEGVMVNRVRSFKMSSLFRNTLFVATGSTLQMAESMAFGRQCMGDVGMETMARKIAPDHQRYVNFFHEQFEYYKDVESLPDVAVLYSYSSMGFNNDRPVVSFMLFTQTLIQARVPFDIIFDRHLKGLSMYRALVLADQECLSEEQMGLIRRYVEEGGGLVATEQTSLYTAWRQRRADFGLKDLLKVHAPPWRGPRALEAELRTAPVQTRFGQGRVVYIATVKAVIEKPPAVPMSSQYWKLPLNWAELIEQVRWAVGGKFRLEVETPETLTVVAEQQEQVGQDRRLVHVVNYGSTQGKTVSNINVEVELPQRKRAMHATLLTPDGESRKTVPVRMEGNRARFTVPHIHTYTLVILDLVS
jgi:hypothetical protein